MVFSSQISLCVVLSITAPYLFYCFVGEQTEQEETPQFRECALLFRKSPNDDFDTSCGVNLHGFHKACFRALIFAIVFNAHIEVELKTAVRTVRYVQHFFTSLTISEKRTLPVPRYP